MNHLQSQADVTQAINYAHNAEEHCKWHDCPFFNSPLLLGFEDFERRIDNSTKMQTEGYPPYNIEKTSKISCE
tara:strand:+ start:13724 stop:13942 length:219 start_codon:yes stop_codon:yes gene_type:complete